MIYLALGDSITHGYDASDEEHRFVTVLTRKLNKVERTSLYMQAKPGWTSAQLLRSLDKVPECVIAEAAIVTLMIGGNDLLKALPWFLDDEEAGNKKLRASFLPTVHAIVEHTKRNPDAVFMICTVYNPFPKSELAQRAISGLNGILREAATAYSCLLVPVDEWYGGEEGTLVNRFKRGELQDFRLVRNPIHPNDKGHVRIADAVFNTYMEIHKQRRAKRGANRQAEPQRFRAKRRPHTASQRAQRRGGGRSAAARPRSGALSMTQSRTGRKRIRDKAARQVYN
ncbi:MAG: SGNH/GDSL hydrolase family protein [Bacilli bacterium]